MTQELPRVMLGGVTAPTNSVSALLPPTSNQSQPDGRPEALSYLAILTFNTEEIWFPATFATLPP